MAEIKSGREVVSSIPKAPPVGLKRPPTLQEQVARLVHGFSKQAEAEGNDTFEEYDDFEVADDPTDAKTPYEQAFDIAQAGTQLKRLQAKQAQRKALAGEYRKRNPKPKPEAAPDAKAADAAPGTGGKGA